MERAPRKARFVKDLSCESGTTLEMTSAQTGNTSKAKLGKSCGGAHIFTPFMNLHGQPIDPRARCYHQIGRPLIYSRPIL